MFFVSIGSHAQFIDPVLSGTVAAGDAAKKKSLDGIRISKIKLQLSKLRLLLIQHK